MRQYQTLPTQPLSCSTAQSAPSFALADAPPHQHRHEWTRQSHLAERQERPRRWVSEFEFVVEDEVREDHFHYDGDVESRRAVVLGQLVSTVVEVSICEDFRLHLAFAKGW